MSAQINRTNNRLKYAYYFPAAASIFIAAIFLAGAIAVLAGAANLKPVNELLAPAGRNWIILFLKLNAGLAGREAVKIYQPVDIVLIFLFMFLFAGFFASMRKKSVIWNVFSVWALVSPLLGLIVLLSTGTAGRTGLLTGSLIYSIMMLFSGPFRKSTAIIGILGSLAILISMDFVTGIFLSKITAGFIGAGYFLWMIWFILAALEFSGQARSQITKGGHK